MVAGRAGLEFKVMCSDSKQLRLIAFIVKLLRSEKSRLVDF